MTGDLPNDPDIERAKMELERQRIDLEVGLRRDELVERSAQREADAKHRVAELGLKRLELQNTAKQGMWNSRVSILIAIATAVFGFLSGIIVERIKGSESLKLEQEKSNSQQALERDKFETTLILKATENKDLDERIRNLKFYIATGYIRDPESRIAKMEANQYPSTTVSEFPPNSASFGTSYGCGRPTLVAARWTGRGGEQVYTSVLPMAPNGLSRQGDSMTKEEFDAVNKVFMENASKVAAFANRWHDYGRMPPPEAVAAFRNSLPQPAHFELVDNCQLEGINLAISRINERNNGEEK